MAARRLWAARSVPKPSSPAIEPDDAGDATIIVIVTPTFNSQEFLDDTILSVVSQSGDFRLRYHIQDGGSTDGTMAIVHRWQRLLRSSDFPILCAGLTFSYDSRPDTGMYQAINHGFAYARPGRPFVMGWINSDDRLAPGALAAINGVYGQFPDVWFTCARVSLIDQHGVITGVNLPVVYDRQALSDGAHDGRAQSFVMQEGSFWRSILWDAVGGLDERFRLAGDWDLWRRFARHAALVTIDSVLGFHRRHAKQLSAALAPYHAEIDAFDRGSGGSLPVGTRVGETLKLDLDSGRWERKRRRGTRVGLPIVQPERGEATATYRVEVTHGARMPEGPYPEAGLPGGMRWIDEPVAAAVVAVPYPGRWEMHLRLRNWRTDLRLLVTRGGVVCLDVMPGAGEDDGDTLLFASLWLEGGVNAIEIRSEGPFDRATGWLFVLLEWYVLPQAASDPPRRQDREGQAAASQDWPAIAVILCAANCGDLDQRLDAIIGQGYPEVAVTVVDDRPGAVNRQIIAAYAGHVDHVVVPDGDHRHDTIGRVIDHSTDRLFAVLDETATLAAGALFALAHAVQQNGRLDLVAGIVVDRRGSTPIARHLPSLPDGDVSLTGLVRSGMEPECSVLFDRAALFFTPHVWRAAGGRLLPASFAAAAFDFWVRCAGAGAVSRTLPVDLVDRAVGWGPRRAHADDVHRLAEGLAEQSGSKPAQPTAVVGRSVLKILILDAEGRGDEPSDECRRIASALATANQRVVCLVGDDIDGAAPLLQAVRLERPDLVIIVGDRLNEVHSEVVAELAAQNIATIDVGECCASADIGTAVGSRDTGRHQVRIGVDTSVYAPDRRTQARRVLDVPVEAFVVLVVGNGSTATSSDLAVTVAAYAQLDCAAKLLMTLGCTGEFPAIAAPIRRVKDDLADDVQALFYAAADVIVSLGEHDEISLVRAAASGTPAIVHGGERDGEESFGVRLASWTEPRLAACLHSLYASKDSYRRLAIAGLTYVRANHSLEASAWSFMTQRIPDSRPVHLASDIEFPIAPPPFAVRRPSSVHARPYPERRWHGAWPQPLTTVQGVTADTGTGIALSAATTAFHVRARHAGPQRLSVRIAACDGGHVVAVRVNGDDCGRIEIVAREDGGRPHSVRAQFFSGLNRVELASTSVVDPAATPPAVLSLALDDDGEAIDPGRCRWQPLVGFAEVDPVEEDGTPGHWIDGPSATLRLWSPAAGARQLHLFLKNYDEPLSVEITVNSLDIGVVDVPTTDFLTADTFTREVALERGWNLLSLAIERPIIAPGVGRGLSLLVTDIYLTHVGGHADPDADPGDIDVPAGREMAVIRAMTEA